MDAPPENDRCAVCHDNYHIPCQANCSHWFCGNCIMQVWHFSSARGPCRCPLCRREITLLVPSEASLRRRHDSDVAEVLGKVERYNRSFSAHACNLVQRIKDLPFFLRRLLRELMDPQRSLPLFVRARVYFAMILSAVYIVSPLDLIPEGILGLVGLLDDLIILLIFFFHISALYRTVLCYRHGGS